MDKDLKLIYFQSLIDNYKKHFDYLIKEIEKIDKYIEIEYEINEIQRKNINIDYNVNIIKYKISQYNILK